MHHAPCLSLSTEHSGIWSLHVCQGNIVGNSIVALFVFWHPNAQCMIEVGTRLGSPGIRIHPWDTFNSNQLNVTPMQQKCHLYLIFKFHWCIIDDSAPYVLCCKTYQNISLCLPSRQPYIKPKQGRIKLVPVLLPSCKVYFFTLLTYPINTYLIT